MIESAEETAEGPAIEPEDGGPSWLRVLPALFGGFLLVLWEAAVTVLDVPRYVLPPPSAIAGAMWTHGPGLLNAALTTLWLAVLAFGLAVTGGIGLAVLFAQSRLLERALYPYAVILQVTPIVAIAPLIVIWVGIDRPRLAILMLAFIVAFFPVLANTLTGLRSVDPNLQALFQLYRANRWQVLWRLRLPNALPYMLAGMKIAGGLSLIAVVTAEFVAGSGGSGGLAWRIMEAANRLEVPRMFAALVLLSLLGIGIYLALSALERRLLAGWHESTLDGLE
ncbi:MAG: ABC transporter permease [Alphaproteobacteria bacterium]